MIEEQKINNEAEDIFADVDDSAPITTLATDSGQVLPPVIMDQYPTHRRMIWLGAIVVVLIIAGAGYYGYKNWFAKPTFVAAPETNQANEVVPNNQVVDKVEQVVATTTDSQVPQPVLNTQAVVDTDRDGLTNEEEVVLGTNINEPDSDGDGLYDREEFKVYKTNPLNPDSDGDGFTDGQEVKGGYNPKGMGKLFEFNIQK